MSVLSNLIRAASSRKHQSAVVISGTMLLLLPVMASASMADNSTRPNFLIIMADDISWTSFGCANPQAFTRTPNIDSLAKQGMSFANFHCSMALCVPVRSELYTALLPPTSGVISGNPAPSGTFKNVNDYLGELGYVTGRAGKNHFKSKTAPKSIPGFSGNCNADKTEWSMDGVKSFIGNAVAEKKNFCAFICSVEAHHPWTMGNQQHFPPTSMTLPPHMVDTPKTREVMSRHAAEVELFDEQVGAALRLLKEMDLDKNTVVIVLSEQGMALPQGKFSIYDFGNRALCVMRWPGHIAAGSITPAVSMYCDIVPTLVDLAGGKPPHGIDGRSMRKALMGEPVSHRKYAYLVYGNYQRAIVDDCFKLVWTPSGKEFSGPTVGKNGSKLYTQAWAEWLEAAKNDPDAKLKVERVLKHPLYELYNIKEDPYELVNLASDPAHAARLKGMISDLKAEIATLKDSMKTNGGDEGDDAE
jgi:uncharacterized sulfatase